MTRVTLIMMALALLPPASAAALRAPVSMNHPNKDNVSRILYMERSGPRIAFRKRHNISWPTPAHLQPGEKFWHRENGPRVAFPAHHAFPRHR